MRGKFEASIFQRIFLEYAGSREEYEKNILELFKKNIVFMLMEKALTKATKDSAVHGVDKNQYLLCSSVVKADERNYYTVKVLQTGLDESQAKAAALARTAVAAVRRHRLGWPRRCGREGCQDT